MKRRDRRERILIVDDHPNNVMILEELLDEHYDLQAAESGEEALELALSFEPDLILLDVMMPGIDGYETCRRLRQLRCVLNSKILMVSARASTADRLEGYAAGADDYLCKPFDHDELLAKIRVYLELRSTQEVDRLKSEFLGILDHEMRTPLTGLIAPLEILSEDSEMPVEERQEFIDIAYGSALRLHRLLERVMLLSSMRSGNHEWRLGECELVACATEARERCAARMLAKGVEVQVHVSGALDGLGDSSAITLLLEELLANAIEASHEGGRIDLELDGDGSHRSIKVRDAGVGIEPDFVPRIFEVFTAPDLNQHSHGHGLGLALVQEVVRAHDGRVSFESQLGAGTCFHVQVQRCPTMAESAGRELTEV